MIATPRSAARRTQRIGFTLIEVLVVVAIIALLISILLPSLTAAKEQARRVSCASNMHQTSLSIATYAADSKGALPHYRNVAGEENKLKSVLDNRFFHKDDGTTTGLTTNLDPYYYTNLGHLWRAKQLKDGKVLYCPSEKNTFYTYDSYRPFPTRNDVGMEGHSYIRVSYNYNPHVKVNMDPRPKFKDLPDYQRLYTDLHKMPTGRTLLIDMLTGGKANFAHLMGRQGGWNISPPDGSVVFRRTNKSLETLQDINSNYPLLLKTLESLERGMVVAKGDLFPDN